MPISRIGTDAIENGAVTPADLSQPLTLATAKAWNWNGLTTNKEIDFTSIPSWVKRITVMFSGVSTNGASNFLVQIGSGSITNTGYDAGVFSSNSANNNSTAGFIVTAANVAAACVYSGSVFLSLANPSSNLWVSTAVLGQSTAPASNGGGNMSGGNKALTGSLDRIRITTVNGTDNFDAGTINIMYEGGL